MSQRNAPPGSPESNELALEEDPGPTPAQGLPQAAGGHVPVEVDDDAEPITSIGQSPAFLPNLPRPPTQTIADGGSKTDPPKASYAQAGGRSARSFGKINTPTEMSMPVPLPLARSGQLAAVPQHAPPTYAQPQPRTNYSSGPIPSADPKPVSHDLAEDSGSRPAFMVPPSHASAGHAQNPGPPPPSRSSHTPSAGRPLPPPPSQHMGGHPQVPQSQAQPQAASHAPFRAATPSPQQASAGAMSGPMGIHPDTAPKGLRAASASILRSHSYAFVLDERGMPVELGSGRSAKAFLGEERWLESKTDFRREVVIKILQKGVSEEDHMRFQMEKELLERVQGHPNIVRLYGSGESEDTSFIPASVRDKVQSEFVIIERMEMSLEERLKGPRERGKREDLLAYDMRERVFRVLDYMIPIASAVEFAHLMRNVCHRDLKPANVLIGLPDPNLVGSVLEIRLADFNIAKVHDEEFNVGMTRTNMNPVPGTLFFQSPEQETNVIELLVNVQQGSAEVEFFEDFYIQIEKNDTFALFNRGEHYPILRADRAKKKIILGRPYRDVSESNVRAKVQKSVGRPADIYSIGAMLYYLISGAYGNPKTIYDNFHKFIEYERSDGSNTIEAYLAHEYSAIEALRSPKAERGTDMAPADKFFSYKHYLDGNGDLIDAHVMRIIAKCMIRNKPDSYCQAHEIETRGISQVVRDLVDLYTIQGTHPGARPANLRRVERARNGWFRRAWKRFWGMFRRR